MFESKATWPTNFRWEGDDTTKVHRDERVVVTLERRYTVPEKWRVIVLVYGPGGCASERTGHFDMVLEGNVEMVLARAEEATVNAGLVIRKSAATVH